MNNFAKTCLRGRLLVSNSIDRCLLTWQSFSFFATKSFRWCHSRKNLLLTWCGIRERFISQSLMTWHNFCDKVLLMTPSLQNLLLTWHGISRMIYSTKPADVNLVNLILMWHDTSLNIHSMEACWRVADIVLAKLVADVILEKLVDVIIAKACCQRHPLKLVATSSSRNAACRHVPFSKELILRV